MREIFTSGSVGNAPGNRCLYPELGSHKAAPLRSATLCARLCETLYEVRNEEATFNNTAIIIV
jgi:hypothetical protein